MYFAVFGTHKPGRVQTGSELQNAFADYLRSHPDHSGVVVHHGGPTLSDDSETPVGPMLIVEAPSLEAARAFLADSPYGKGDVFASSEVRPFDWRTGRPGS
ncbi:MAG: YciI family protein [Rhodospirillaceae bacterium]|nr:YciI family protein [Rhodospirillaceae bacterium]